MKQLIAIVATLILTATGAPAVETVEGGMGCLTEPDFESLAQLRINNDQEGINRLIASRRCQVLEANLPVSVIEMTETRAHIRVFRKNSSQVLWTTRDAVKNLPK